MRTEQLTILTFQELTIKAKEKAIENYYNKEEYHFLSEDLTENLKEYLKEKGCEFYNLHLYYSLSNSQGDGLCFIGSIFKNGIHLKLTHNGRYFFAKSVTMQFFDEQSEEIEGNEELKTIYLDICNRLEKEGYSMLEYRMNFEEFAEYCEENKYEFLENGERY